MRNRTFHIVRAMTGRALPLCLFALLPLFTSCGDLFEFDEEAVVAGDMELGRSSIDLMVGDQYQIPVSFTPDTLTIEDVYWYTSDESIVVIEDNVVKAVGEGTAIVTAISVSGQYQAACTVNVHNRWSLVDFHLPYDMVLYGDITIKGRPMDEYMTVAAFIDGELRGVSKMHEYNGIRYVALRIFSEEQYGKWVTLKCYDASTATMYDMESTFAFDEESYGSLSQLLHFTIE